jgi:hypothetical protein
VICDDHEPKALRGEKNVPVDGKTIHTYVQANFSTNERHTLFYFFTTEVVLGTVEHCYYKETTTVDFPQILNFTLRVKHFWLERKLLA